MSNLCWKSTHVNPYNGVRHFSKINARLHVGQMFTDGTSTNAGIRAHAVQNAYLRPWNVTKLPKRNESDEGGKEFGGVEILGTLKGRWRLSNASFLRTVSWRLRSIRLSRSGLTCTSPGARDDLDRALEESDFALIYASDSSVANVCVRSEKSLSLSHWFD